MEGVDGEQNEEINRQDRVVDERQGTEQQRGIGGKTPCCNSLRGSVVH